MRDWLVRGGTYYVAVSVPTSLSVDVTDPSWSAANGTDADRFLWAARESVIPRSAGCYDSRSLGWAAVAAYYGSFFSVQALLRMLGRGYLYLSQDDVAQIGVAPGTTVPLQPGVYALSISPGTRVRIKLEKQSVRGVHDGFWRFADTVLDAAIQDIGNGVGFARPFSQTHRAEAMMSLEDFRQALGRAGRPGRDVGWMSALRNEVNYQLKRDVWAPTYRTGAASVERLRSDLHAIVRGSREDVGPGLRLDPDLKALFERSSQLFREVGRLGDLPALT
jgi:hypothetical protein